MKKNISFKFLILPILLILLLIISIGIDKGVIPGVPGVTTMSLDSFNETIDYSNIFSTGEEEIVTIVGHSWKGEPLRFKIEYDLKNNGIKSKEIITEESVDAYVPDLLTLRESPIFQKDFNLASSNAYLDRFGYGYYYTTRNSNISTYRLNYFNVNNKNNFVVYETSNNNIRYVSESVNGELILLLISSSKERKGDDYYLLQKNTGQIIKMDILKNKSPRFFPVAYQWSSGNNTEIILIKPLFNINQ
jgi:hypothetical protein